jgi:2-C-methyl-D-erythritol 4-phosphate cytidylyltransferase/2-C-methyl-D-erythritol 2,4-cyclodiphosphate synthase
LRAALLKDNKMTIRMGIGYDVHAFSQNESGPVRICGIDMDHHHKLLGHSDADVGLHAITDAILGAIAEGDIGLLFPPSDDKWKNADSAIFLEEAVRLVKAKNAVINNIDITIICEQPKVGPYRKAMQERIASICGLAIDQVNVKGTTTERLGFTGRGEGIAAQAIATIDME